MGMHPPCGSEFIRESVGWAMHFRRMYRPLANEFAPTPKVFVLTD